MPPLVNFKFKRLNEKGKRVGFLSERAQISELDLTLGDQVIPLWKIKLASRYPGHLLLRLNGEQDPLVVAFTGGNAAKVLSTLNLRSSFARARWHQQELVAQGKGDLFASLLCPHCGATNELSGHQRTPQAYCRHCDTVFTVSDRPLPYEGGYHMCGTCGTYGLVKSYTSFFFVFAVFFYYLESNPHRECRTCMRSRVWKTLAANLPFFVGTPPALWQIARAYWPASGPLATLDDANCQVKKKRWERAIHEYEVIQQKVRHCASVRYNHSLALHAANKPAEAVKKLEQALADCANFRPAYVALTRSYEVLRMTDRLDDLLRSWSYAESLGAGQ